LFINPRGAFVYLKKAVRWMWDLGFHCAKEMWHDHAPQMAAALTYRTIFSLVPMVVLGLLLLRAVMPMPDIKKTLETKAFEFTGLNSLALPSEAEAARESGEVSAPLEAEPASQAAPAPLPVSASTQPASTQPATDAATVRAARAANKRIRSNITTIISGLADKVASISLPSIGIVGFLLFIWAALAMAITVEQIFNQVFNASQGRPWRTRIPIYWTIITLGPPLAVVSLTFSASAASYVKEFVHTAGMGWAVTVVSRLAALGTSWMLLWFLYVLMPNTRVDKRSALIGAGVTAVAWECLKVGFAFYVTRTVPFSALYGTLGLLPLFLLWIYLTWMVVLFGLELTYTLQSMKTGQLKHLLAADARDAIFDPRRIITLMTLLANEFLVGRSVGRDRLLQLLHVPAATLTTIMTALESNNLVNRVMPRDAKAAGEPRYTLARPPEKIPLAELVAVGQALADASHPPSTDAHPPAEAFIKKMAQATQAAAGNTNLAQLLAPQKVG